MKLSVSFPHMGDYHIPVCRLIKALLPEAAVFPAPAITKHTIGLGSRVSPDYVCSPFKYNMGNFIQSLDMGANVLLQTGIGCRYGFYGEVQEQILRDLGYRFEFICMSREKAKPVSLYKTLKRLGSPLSLPRMIYEFILSLLMIHVMDNFDYKFRKLAGFEHFEGSIESVRKKMLKELSETKSAAELFTLKRKYKKEVKSLNIILPKNPLRVGIVGELYTVMEPFSNFFIEKQLAKSNISVSRVMSASFLLFGKHDRFSLMRAKGYLKRTIGANGVDSVAQSKRYAKLGYDGIIHIKSFGCTPELNAEPALTRLGSDYKIPILNLSFDTHTSETGLETRIEAFCDMISAVSEAKNSIEQRPVILRRRANG